MPTSADRARLPAGVLPLVPGEVHVFLTEVDGAESPAQLADYSAVLDEGERDRAARFHFERDRRHFLVAHALLRAALSCFQPVPAAAWRFVAGSHGRPSVAEPALAVPLHFSLSHTHGLVGVAVSLSEAVGFDVEHRRRREVSDELAAACLAPAELVELRRLGPGVREDRFFQIWTLKEAYVKARGLGLSLPLEQIAFTLRDEEPVRVSLDPRLGDDARRWQFVSLSPTAEHAGAVALRADGDEALRLRRYRMAPLALLEPLELGA